MTSRDQSEVVKQYYEEIASKYDEDRFANSYGRYIHAQESAAMKKWMNKSGRNLSMACGTGRFMEYASHGIDISGNMVEEAIKKYPDKQFYIGPAEHTPFPDEHFDQIFALHLLMHLPEGQISSLLTEAHRILKPAGTLIIDFPSQKRRQVTGHKQKNWHAATSFTIDAFDQLAGPSWYVKDSLGVAFFPVHRFPTAFRPFIRLLDSWICRTPLKLYASYLMVKLQRQ
jgi:ubiquinone/menaquinone biosynthesis C-methylase UbiE